MITLLYVIMRILFLVLQSRDTVSQRGIVCVWNVYEPHTPQKYIYTVIIENINLKNNINIHHINNNFNKTWDGSVEKPVNRRFGRSIL